MTGETEQMLRKYAAEYENSNFINGDPSRFMHQVDGNLNKETVAFVASSVSYGNRKQFMPKIQWIIDAAEGDVYSWIKEGRYKSVIAENDTSCFYRLYTRHTMYRFFEALQDMLATYGSIGNYIKGRADDGLSAVEAITSYFAERNIEGIIPKNTSSACKRICMFIRWMVRDNSPVDIGLWSSFIDKKTLIIPMDTHVMQQARRMGLIDNKTASMSAAVKLTRKLAKIFPEDPLKGDFALFGYGINNK
ncbi:MAG: TIGR02757 family protein [Prevotella sp.]